MKLSTVAAFCLSALFAITIHAEDSDFGDEPSTTPPASDVSAPPSSSQDYNNELSDAVGNEEPKVPAPEVDATKPSPPAHKAEKAKKKEKKSAKKDSASKKSAKKEKSGKKDKSNKKDKSGKHDKSGKKSKKTLKSGKHKAPAGE